MSPEVLEQTDVEDIQLPVEASRSQALTAADIRLALELHDSGQTQVQIAQALKCSQSTVSRTLKAFNADAKAIARQLRAFTDETIEDWRKARKVAADRGDHRPARELLEAAHPELRPQTTNTGAHGGVTVIVAVPNSENPRPLVTVQSAPQTLTTQTMALSQPALPGGGDAPNVSASCQPLEVSPSLSSSQP